MTDDTLHEIGVRYLELLESDEPYTEEKAKELTTTGDSFQVTVGNLAGFVERCLDEVFALTRRKEAIEARIKTREAQVKYLKDYLKENMEATGITKISWGTHRISLQKNSQPKLVAEEGAEAPEEFLVPQPPRRDDAAIKAALLSGREIDGFGVETGWHIRIW